MEDGICNFSGTAQVRYGLSGNYAVKTATNTIGCNNAVFGDPFPGADKICEYASTVPSPTPSPTPTPAPTPTPTPSPGVNVVELENAKTAADGVTDAWIIDDANYASGGEIEGYASAVSVNRGESISLYVSTSDPTYTISVYRMGWYGGKGGRLVAGPVTRTGKMQAAPSVDASVRLVECNWTDPYVLSIPNNASDPTDWASGIYLAKLTGSSGKQSYIVFTVRDDARSSALLFQQSVTTYAAYNNWGGYDFYGDDSAGGQAAYKLSFNRPYSNPQRPANGKGAGDFFSWEAKALRFFEREGYDVAYTTNIDTDNSPSRILSHKGFLSVGHDEYWTKAMRDALESARNAGVNLGFLGANTGYWQVRLEPSPINSQPNRTVVAYKYDAPTADPLFNSNPSQATYLFRSPPINRPEAALIGVMYDYNSVDLDMVIADCISWICNKTSLQTGSVLSGMLGYEIDRVDPTYSPAGIAVIAASPYNVGTETRYANMTYYTHSSGAGVFATGSMQWNWGLDSFGEFGDRVNPDVQQITRNVLDKFVGK